MHLFVDNLINVDFSYLHPARGMLGETWIASTTMAGALDPQGMICDFGVVKSTIRNWLNSELDHRLAVPLRSPNLTLEEQGDHLRIHWRYGDRTLNCLSPRSAIALLDVEEITPELAARWSCEQLRALLPGSLLSLQLEFATEAISGEFYHYSHGLKKHGGNCQRIAHGHRSTIAIWRNGQRDSGLEQEWAQQFRDIYIGTREDLVAPPTDTLEFAYQTPQGQFELSMPAPNCYLIDSDTTVELIAAHILQQLQQNHPGDLFRVKAFEGMGKGAIVEG
ncbi:6-carboxytetrahydropterin synthase [Pseudomaricurvus sp. HS19]|uniref:6-carboxytetrahydropterin synthase n=1 Tax=Pseudomaricurvus sp. HS19 TaxID=2692626 RepID=UPI0013687059|nr:6-carboxytetrahydropterin synthase [Pseudomaricurvus sp. HS19]MYM62600.1 hypothetical protein [Pseudomaricurvus sp. HS19]